MRMTGYYSHTLHTGSARDLRRRESVKGVKGLEVNRHPRARIPHERSECKNGSADVKGAGLCRVCRFIRARARTLTVKLWTRHTLHTRAITAGQGG
jgi:hypothetical protein